MNNIGKLVTSIVVCQLAGLLATPFTTSSVNTWYTTLAKPAFSPPNWVFGPVWTTLYFLMGVSLYLIWQKGTKNKKVKVALYFFAVQLFLNFIWSLLFFGLRSPALALIEIIALLALIVITAYKFYGIDKIAAYLLIPYILWVSFATILNLSIVILN